VQRCLECTKEVTTRHQPLIPTEFPERPWQRIAMDLFHLEGVHWLLVTDYYSRYPEICKLPNITAETVVTHCKSIFARHGVSETVVSDNGTQFSKVEGSSFSKFAKEYGFNHIISSPKYPQSNGFAEAGVKIVKNCLKKSHDQYEALLNYRTTPLQNGYSPAELLMGRRLRTKLPTTPIQLKPRTVDEHDLRGKEDTRRKNQKRNVDRRHGVTQKEQDLKEGEVVWVKDQRTWGTVAAKATAPRSFIVKTPRGEIRRNRFSLTRTHKTEADVKAELDPTPESPAATVPVVPETTTTTSSAESEASAEEKQVEEPEVRRSGRTTKPPDRYESSRN